tara:strand:+ start:35496 stop:39446 length:3951 start_codon:yes stop_codon:yes gene_type:complete
MISFAQNWNQVGNAKFTNFAKDGAMAFHPTTGNPYIIYANVLDANKPYVVKFDGTSWVTVGTGAIIANEATLINIAFNPANNEPNVAFKNETTDRIDLYKFDGTSWTAIKTSLSGSEALKNAQLSIQYDANNNIYVFGNKNSPNRLRRFYDVGIVNGGGTSSWSYDEVYSSSENVSYPTSYNKYVVNNTFNHPAVVQRADVYHHIFNTGNNEYHKNIDPARLIKMTSVAGGNYWAGQNDAVGNAGSKKIIFGYKDQTTAQPLNTDNNTGATLALAEDKTQNRVYLMYSDTNEKLKFQKYSSSFWSSVPDLNISTNTAGFFSKIKFNATDNFLYLLFLDEGKLSVKKYQPTPSFVKYYVNANVSGGDGSGDSWVNAKTDLKDVFTEIGNNTTEIWVAKGTYKPGTSRTDAYNISIDNLKIYGGFIGTETTIIEREITNNPTILSGDLNGDDAGVDFTTATRSDNSYQIVKINANDVLLDGFTIQDGHANGGSGNNEGAAINKAETANALNLKNCTIKNNVSLIAGNVRSWFDVNGTTNIENCIFDGNVSTYSSGLYLGTRNNRTLDITIINSLFSKNISKNNGGTLGFTGSSAWIRANGTNSTINTNIVNTTFANNIDTGSQAALTNKGTLSLAKTSGTHNATISNSIFFNNTETSGATSLAVTQGHVTAADLVLVNNSIDENNFSNLSFLTNTSDLDPMFVDVANNNYRIQAVSPAKDAGDNTKIPTGIATDLFFNPRITDTTVDMGAYEYCTNCKDISTLVVNVQGNGSVSTSGGTFSLGSTKTITATPDAGYLFTGFTGDVTSSVNPLTVALNSSLITINANFIELPIYVDVNASGNNDGSSWANAYTNLHDAIDEAGSGTQTIWVAKGTYKPTTLLTANNTDVRRVTFLINNPVKIYGGFLGNEMSLDARDSKLNATILSGDLNGDDSAIITDVETTRQDNAYHVVSIKGNFADGGFIDGFTITGGNSNGTLSNNCATADPSQYYDAIGAAIYANPDDANTKVYLDFKNCIIEKNSGENYAAYGRFNPCGTQQSQAHINFESCIIRGNYSKNTENIGFFGSQRWHTRTYNKVVNSAIYNNTTAATDRASAILISSGGGSASYPSASSYVELTNTTISGNISPNNKAINMNMYTATGSISNTIIYGNGGANPIIFAGNQPPITNSIIEGGQLTGSTDADPLLNPNYTLQAGSPAIDIGDNSLFPAHITKDLLGNARVFNTTIDMGAFEYDPSVLSTENISIVNETKIYPNPVRNNLHVKSKENILKIEVYNLLGKKIIEKENSSFINLSNLASSMYIVRVYKQKGIVSKRIIKK